MSRIRGIRPAFQRPGQPVEHEVDDEFAFHLEMRTRELIAQGMRADTAHAEALRMFGDMDDARRYCRDLSERREKRAMRIELLDGWRHDLAFAMRSLRRSPGFTLAAVITLALGVGANVAMFGIVDRLLLRPPAGVSASELVRRLYFTQFSRTELHTDASISYPAYVAIAESMRPVATVGAFFTTEMVIGEPGESQRANVTMATSTFLPALGVRPALGRFFTPEEDTPPAGVAVAVISHSLWNEAYGGDSAVLGRTLTVAGRRHRIIGVTPPGFTGLEPQRVGAWVPLSAFGADVVGQFVRVPWHQARNIGWLRSIARVRNEAALPEAERLAAAGFRGSLEARWSAARVDSARPRASLESLLLERGPDRTPSARIAVWLAGMSLLVVLISCANVANLLLARALSRRRELAVRMALGAGRARLVAQLLGEGMMIAALGGVAALVVAWSGGRIVSDILLPEVDWGGTLFDGRTLVAAAIIVMGTGLLIGLVPALQASDISLVGSLKTGARDGGGRRSLTRAGLVVMQAALSLVLLAGAGLFLRSLHNARSVQLGFSTDRVLTLNLDITGTGYSNEESLALYDQLHQRVSQLPGVESASLAFTEPFATTISYAISIPGRDSVVLPPSGAPEVNAVTPEFFATMGTRILAGRGFRPDDRAGSTPVTVISEQMASSLWPGRSPLGERVCVEELANKPCFEIVGVAQEARWKSLRDDPPMQMYFALAQNPSTIPLRVLHLRTSGDEAAVMRAVRDAVRQVAPRVLYADVEPLAGNIEPEMRPWRVGATVFTLFGALALVLAGLGLYSVIAYDVAQRTQEMAVRIALGARATQVLRLVVTQGMRLAMVGIVVGTLIAVAAARWVAPLLFDTAPSDPLVLGAVSMTLFGVAVAASLIPAWRATRVAPGAALRAE